MTLSHRRIAIRARNQLVHLLPLLTGLLLLGLVMLSGIGGAQ